LNYGTEGLSLRTETMARVCDKFESLKARNKALEAENEKLREELRMLRLIDQVRDGKGITNPTVGQKRGKA
jgi:cell division protein FtsB